MSAPPTFVRFLALFVGSGGLAACADDPGQLQLQSTTRPYPAVQTSADVLGVLNDAVDDTAGGTLDGGPIMDAASDTTADTTTGPTGPISTNAGFIGSACTSVATCDYADAMCLDGWPNGHCSKTCDRFCPDRAGLATTFCIAANTIDAGVDGGRCVQRCDFGQSPTGCRAGYTCRALSRFNEASVTAPVCVPGDAPPEVSPCIAELVARGIDFQLATNPMDSPDGGTEICDVRDPVRIAGRVGGVDFRYADFDASVGTLFVTCEAALAIHDTARVARSLGIRAFTHLGTYNCRYIGGTERLSQHAFANAIDLSGVETDAGAQYTLFNHWERGVANPTTPGGMLLKQLAQELHRQTVWNIILTPEYNSAHWDHFHVDLTEGAYSLN